MFVEDEILISFSKLAHAQLKIEKIEEAQNVYAGRSYNNSSTSADTQSDSGVLHPPQQPELQAMQEFQLPQLQELQQAASQSPPTQFVNNIIVSTGSLVPQHSSNPAPVQGNNLVNQILTFLSTAGFVFVIAGGIPYLIQRNRRSIINQRNDSLRGLGVERGAHDFSVMTRSQGYNVLNRNIFGVPYTPRIQVPDVPYDLHQQFSYLSGVREGRELAMDEYSATYPQAHSTMRRALNENPVIVPSGSNNQGNSYNTNSNPIGALLISLLVAILNSQNENGRIDIGRLFHFLHRKNDQTATK